MRRERIDKLLCDNGLADSLAKAQAFVMSGVVLVNEQKVSKSSQEFLPTDNIRIKGNDLKFVSRGGLKLEKALQHFEIDVKDLVCLDIGASTGGFTDCLLQNGAKKVVAIDVGTNQLVWKLRTDERVESRENVNARSLTHEDFSEKFDIIVMDVSFISATKILSVIPPLMYANTRLIVLIKPQFEVRKSEVGKGGIVLETEKHERVITEVNEFAETIGLQNIGVIDSPILGAEGNKEFLAAYEKQVGTT
jgi:23S rRNA (cytidine1920-2'-O)/16S rRNA (cytidine1409-2'-O)-methyltransferase